MKTSIKYFAVCAIIMWLFLGNLSQCSNFGAVGSVDSTQTADIARLRHDLDSIKTVTQKLESKLFSLDETQSEHDSMQYDILDRLKILESDSVKQTYIWDYAANVDHYKLIFTDTARDTIFKTVTVYGNEYTATVPTKTLGSIKVIAINSAGQASTVKTFYW